MIIISFIFILICFYLGYLRKNISNLFRASAIFTFWIVILFQLGESLAKNFYINSSFIKSDIKREIASKNFLSDFINMINNSTKQTDILFLGSSAVREGISAQFFEQVLSNHCSTGLSALNLGIPEGTFSVAMSIFNLLEKSNFKHLGYPKFLIYGVTPFELNENFKSSMLRLMQSREMNEKSILNKTFDSFYLYKLGFIPEKELWSFFIRRKPDIENNNKTHRDILYFYKNFNIQANKFKELLDLKKISDRHNIEFILLEMPVASKHFEGNLSTEQLRKYTDYMDHMTTKYNIKYIKRFKYEDNFFLKTTDIHLNTLVGMPAFTVDLANYFIASIFKDCSPAPLQQKSVKGGIKVYRRGGEL